MCQIPKIIMYIISLVIFLLISFNFNVISGFLSSHLTFAQVSMMATILLAVVITTWQLNSSNRISKTDLLVRIETRYGSVEILEAREIIKKIMHETEQGSTSRENHISLISAKILELDSDANKTREMTILVNFLEFLESISYYTKKGYVPYEDIEEMFSNVPYWYHVYYEYIERLKTNTHNNYLYKELADLSKRLSASKKMICCLYGN